MDVGEGVLDKGNHSHPYSDLKFRKCFFFFLN